MEGFMKMPSLGILLIAMGGLLTLVISRAAQLEIQAPGRAAMIDGLRLTI
jgi:hypothetical protein